MKRIWLTILILFLTLSLTACNKTLVARKEYHGYLDTSSFVIVEYSKQKAKQVELDLNNVSEILLEVEKEFSVSQTIYMKQQNIDKSTTMLINERSGQKISTKVSDNFLKLLKIANEVSTLSDGAFDVTIGALTDLWEISKKAEFCMDGSESISSYCTIPKEVEIEEAKSLVDYRMLEIDENDKTVYLPIEGMKLDFGGIAKGFAADLIKEFLLSAGYNFFIINLGGNVVIQGDSVTQPEGVSTVVTNPFGGEPLVKFITTNASVVTSGTYERYIISGNKKYHHILNPITGYPVNTNLLSVTIIGESSAMCDALSTALFSLGKDDSFAYLNKSDLLDGIFIDEDKNIFTTFDVTKSAGFTNDFSLTIEE